MQYGAGVTGLLSTFDSHCCSFSVHERVAAALSSNSSVSNFIGPFPFTTLMSLKFEPDNVL